MCLFERLRPPFSQSWVFKRVYFLDAVLIEPPTLSWSLISYEIYTLKPLQSTGVGLSQGMAGLDCLDYRSIWALCKKLQVGCVCGLVDS